MEKILVEAGEQAVLLEQNNERIALGDADAEQIRSVDGSAAVE